MTLASSGEFSCSLIASMFTSFSICFGIVTFSRKNSEAQPQNPSMAITDFLPKEYGYVVLVLVFYCFLNLWMGAQVGRARKRFNVPYPTLYAIESENKEAKLFNCVQRGHQNSLEMMPMYFILMILGGMKHPCISTGLGLLYNVSRFFYFKGYATGDPMKRLTIGKYGFLGLLGLMICTISFGVTLILA